MSPGESESIMSQRSVTRARIDIILTTAAALLASQACGNKESPPAGPPAAPSEGGSSSSAGAGTTASGGTPEPGGQSASQAGTGVTPGAAGAGDDADPNAPLYEQDDPDLQPPETSYELVEISAQVTNAMAIDIDEQERVYVLERGGGLKIWYPAEGRVVQAGIIPVFAGNEDGALSITLDPSFATNGRVYIYYSASNAQENRLSRFQITADRLEPASERVLLRVPDQREERFHVGGGTDFDAQGNLYLGTGDNTDPFASDGFSPHDERAGRVIWDAQRSAANSRDLRGKVLRIRPTEEGGYTIPEGNLFTPDQGLPEIYTMGNRNPFRLAIDAATGWLYWGDVGPDSATDTLATRGPQGHDEFNQAKASGFFGWPYCIGANIPYVRYDFAASTSGAPFDCSAPVNESPNNAGVRELPPAQPAWISYTYGTTPYPALDPYGGRTAIIGDIYRWKPGGSPNKLPRYYDGSVFLLEYSRNLMAEVRTDPSGNILSVNDFFDSFTWSALIQARISPSGVLHIAQFGEASTVYRVNYVSRAAVP
jgi:cytochrome c